MSAERRFPESTISSVHGTIVPAEVREGDGIHAKLIVNSGGIHLEKTLRVWKMSPLGIELMADGLDTLPKGIVVDLEVQIGFHKSVLSGLLVDDIIEENGKRFLHIRLTPRTRERIESVERRTASRWICSDDFFPTGVASNPAKFNDFIYFKIRDISVGGLKIHTSLRNKFIISGMVFDCLINFPMISQIKVQVVVKSVRVELIGGKEVLAIGVTYDTNDRETSSVVAQYLVQFGASASLEELRTQGFATGSISDAVSFSFVRTKEEYDQILELRHIAYRAAGKVDAQTRPEEMADAFDARSRIVIGKYKGQVVASARLIFNQFEDRMEQENFVKWPEQLPRRDEMVEITRACTRPEFRRSDLLIAMFRFIAVTVTHSKRKWIVICATDEMSPLYRRIGFLDQNLSYAHTKLNGLKHNILLANVPDAMAGKTVDFVTWNIVWSGVSSYLGNYSLLQSDQMTNIRLSIFRLLGPLANLIYKLEKAFRKRRNVAVKVQRLANG